MPVVYRTHVEERKLHGNSLKFFVHKPHSKQCKTTFISVNVHECICGKYVKKAISGCGSFYFREFILERIKTEGIEQSDAD